MIGIIGAMSAEVEALKAKMSGTVCERISGIEFVRGTLGNKDAVVAQCGIGKVFAAICTEIMIVRFGVDTVINTGVAGTLSDKIGILDFAISSSVVQHDMDTTAIGILRLDECEDILYAFRHCGFLLLWMVGMD